MSSGICFNLTICVTVNWAQLVFSKNRMYIYVHISAVKTSQFYVQKSDLP